MEHIGLLDVHHLTVEYPDGERILQDVSLHIHEGEIVCVIGESGCGKSTLLNAILQMPGQLDIVEGEILFHGQNLRALPREDAPPAGFGHRHGVSGAGGIHGPHPPNRLPLL